MFSIYINLINPYLHVFISFRHFGINKNIIQSITIKFEILFIGWPDYGCGYHLGILSSTVTSLIFDDYFFYVLFFLVPFSSWSFQVHYILWPSQPRWTSWKIGKLKAPQRLSRFFFICLWNFKSFGNLGSSLIVQCF